MFHLIPAPAHRVGLRLAHGLRKRFRSLAKPDLRGVAVLLQDDNGRLLLVTHSYGPRGWALPGGGVGRGEEPEDAARREIREELGVELEALRELGRFEEMLSGTTHTAYAFGAAPTGTIHVDGREIVDARWFAREALADLHLTNVTRRRLGQLGWF